MGSFVTPNPDLAANDEFARFIRQEIQAELARSAQPPVSDPAAPAAPGATPPVAPVAPAPQPLVVTIDGQPHSFNSVEELNAALSQTFNNFRTTLASAQQPKAGSHVTGEEAAPQFEIKQFIELMGSNPVQAFDYVDNFRPGVKEQREKQAINEKVMAAYMFKDAHPEFAGGEPAAQILDRLRASLNLPFDVNGLEAAYAVGVTRGLFPSVQQQQAQQQPVAPPQPNPFAGQPQQNVLDPRQWGNVGSGGYTQQPQPQVQPQPQYQFQPASAFSMPYQFPLTNPYLQAPPGVSRVAPPPAQDNTASLMAQIENLSPEAIERIFSQAGRGQ